MKGGFLNGGGGAKKQAAGQKKNIEDLSHIKAKPKEE
jgi:hypothetical protein